MSNVAIFNPGANLPAFARSGVSEVGKALAGGSGQTGKRVSVKGGVFRLMVDGKEVTAIDERYMDVVIVNTAPKVSRTYYEGTFDDANPTAPACWSAAGDVPDPSIKAPKGANCATCPMNAKGSGQGDSRACRYSQRLAVVLANDQEGDVLQLSLAATSLFGNAEGDNRPLQDYAKWLIAQGVDPTMVVTRLKFDTKVATPKLFFKAMRWLTDEEFAQCQTQGKSPDAIKAITMTVSQMDGAPAAPAPMPFAGKPPVSKAPTATAVPQRDADDEDEAPAPAPKTAKKAKAAPAPAASDDDEEAPAPEPKVRQAAAKPAAVVPAASGVAKTLDAWDDED